MAMRRTTMYSSAGKKLYAVRAADGTFKDIQTYQRAHRADMARKSAAETAAAVKKAAKKKSPAKKAAKKAAQESHQEGRAQGRREEGRTQDRCPENRPQEVIHRLRTTPTPRISCGAPGHRSHGNT